MEQDLNIAATEILKSLMTEQPQTTAGIRQLFIGNLPFRVRWQDIKDLFRKAGHVVRADVALNHDNRSKGHGTVLFTTVEEAQKAILMFNGYKWQGRTLEVRGDRSFVDTEEAILMKPIEDDDNTATACEKKDKEEIAVTKSTTPVTDPKEETEEVNVNSDCKQLFVGNIPFHCQTAELKELFQTCGRIIKVDIVLNFEGRSRGFGTVLFNTHKDAKDAIDQFDGYEFHNRILRVHFDKFAASHQKLREQEAETYGQRQLQDPASVELLKETYLPQQTSSYSQLINGLLKPTAYNSSYSTQSQMNHFGMYQQQQPYDNRAYYQPWTQQQQYYNDTILSNSLNRMNLSPNSNDNSTSAGLNNNNNNSSLWNHYK